MLPELLVNLDFYNTGVSEYTGTRAMLEAEGIIPAGTAWPEGFDRLAWKDGRFEYWLVRQRPPGAKGHRKQFTDTDWWNIRWALINRPSFAELQIARKNQELKDVIYHNSAKGNAEFNANWSRYWKAKTDNQFQAFKSTIPGLVPAKRGRRVTKQGENHVA